MEEFKILFISLKTRICFLLQPGFAIIKLLKFGLYDGAGLQWKDENQQTRVAPQIWKTA